MEKANYCKWIAAGVVAFGFASGSAWAQIPSIDPGSVSSTVQKVTDTVKQSKFITDSTTFLNKTMSTVGTYTKTVTEFAANAKEKVAEGMEKVNKYKSDVEKYQKDLKEYKEFVEQKKKAITDAYGDAKGIASGVKDAGAGLKGAVQDKISSVSGVNVRGLVGNSEGSSDALLTDDGAALYDEEMSLAEENDDEYSREELISSSRRAFRSENLATAAKIRDIGQNKAALRADTQMQMQNAALGANANMATAATQVRLEKAKLNTRAMELEKAQLEQVERARIEQAAQATKAVQEKVSAAKIENQYNKAAVATSVGSVEKVSTMNPSTVALAKEAKNAVVDAQRKEILQASDAVEKVSLAKDISAVKLEGAKLKRAVASEAVSAQKVGDKDEIQRNIVSDNAVKSKVLSVQDKLNTVVKKQLPQDRQRSISPLRKSFNRGKVNAPSIEVQPQKLQDAAFKSSAKMSGNEPLMFASLLGLGDNGTNENGTVIVPPTIGLICELSSSKALKQDALNKCLSDLNASAKRAQATEVVEAAAVYHQGKKELIAAYIATGYKNQKEMEDFIEKEIDPLETAADVDVQSLYGNIVETDKAIAKVINNLAMLQSSRLALNAYNNYGVYKFSTPEEDE